MPFLHDTPPATTGEQCLSPTQEAHLPSPREPSCPSSPVSPSGDQHEDPDRMQVDYDQPPPPVLPPPHPVSLAEHALPSESITYRPPSAELGGYIFPPRPMTQHAWPAQPTQQAPAPTATGGAVSNGLPPNAPRMRLSTLDLAAQQAAHQAVYGRMAVLTPPPEDFRPAQQPLPSIQPAVRARIAVVIALPGPEGGVPMRRHRPRPAPPSTGYLPILRLRYDDHNLASPESQTDTRQRRRRLQRRRSQMARNQEHQRKM